MLRLNVAIPPAADPNINGILGGDLAGFPNGRRVFDNVVAIELRAIAGATYPLVDPTFTPDGAAGLIYDVISATPDPIAATAAASATCDRFPYLDHPVSGYDVGPAVGTGGVMTTATTTHPHPARSRIITIRTRRQSYAHVRGGPTVLDIGGDIGAMIVTMDAGDGGHGAAPAIGARAADRHPHRRLAPGVRGDEVDDGGVRRAARGHATGCSTRPDRLVSRCGSGAVNWLASICEIDTNPPNAASRINY